MAAAAGTVSPSWVLGRTRDGNVVSLSKDGVLRRSGEIVKDLRPWMSKHNLEVSSGTLSPDGSRVAVGLRQPKRIVGLDLDEEFGSMVVVTFTPSSVHHRFVNEDGVMNCNDVVATSSGFFCVLSPGTIMTLVRYVRGDPRWRPSLYKEASRAKYYYAGTCYAAPNGDDIVVLARYRGNYGLYKFGLSGGTRAVEDLGELRVPGLPEGHKRARRLLHVAGRIYACYDYDSDTRLVSFTVDGEDLHVGPLYKRRKAVHLFAEGGVLSVYLDDGSVGRVALEDLHEL